MDGRQGAVSGHYLLVEEGHECVLCRETTQLVVYQNADCRQERFTGISEAACVFEVLQRCEDALFRKTLLQLALVLLFF